jgi:stearoyl-CoA desaturase (delta-9 desaturase)
MVPVTGMLGITLCYHRLLTHRSFSVPKFLEYFLTVCGVLAMQGGPLKWVATHRIHHAFSDRPQDPHSPTRGFWWAHMLWLFPFDEALDDPTKNVRFVPELTRDRVIVWLERYQGSVIFAHGLALFVIGGLPALIWGFFVRAIVVYHSTWLVNSATHLWGYQTFSTNEGSRNNWWVAVLTFGEGWHNNHHAYPTSAAHGLRWWEFDITYLTIRFLAVLGLVKNIRLPQGGPAALPKFDPSLSAKLRRLTAPIPTLSV